MRHPGSSPGPDDPLRRFYEAQRDFEAMRVKRERGERLLGCLLILSGLSLVATTLALAGRMAWEVWRGSP